MRFIKKHLRKTRQTDHDRQSNEPLHHIIRTDNKTIIKRDNPALSSSKKQIAARARFHQKQILQSIRDHLHDPEYPEFLLQILQSTQTQNIMRDLGDTDLLTLLNENYDVVWKNLDDIISQMYYAFIKIIKANVVHLDIKLENIMAQYNPITDDNVRITFVDFTDSLSKKDIQSLPQFDLISGTDPYKSPELIRRILTRSSAKGRFDEYLANALWSLGMVVYVLIYRAFPIDLYYNDRKKRSLRELDEFYNKIGNNRSLQKVLFPTKDIPRNRLKYVQDAKALLSFHPEVRLDWLNTKKLLMSSQKRSTKK